MMRRPLQCLHGGGINFNSATSGLIFCLSSCQREPGFLRCYQVTGERAGGRIKATVNNL
jgi:hypothetical protein